MLPRSIARGATAERHFVHHLHEGGPRSPAGCRGNVSSQAPRSPVLAGSLTFQTLGMLDGLGAHAIFPRMQLSMVEMMMNSRIMTAAVIVGAAIISTSANAGNARGHAYTPQPGDTPLQIKCRTEAHQMISGGKGSTQYAEYNRELRREHFKKCMAGG